MLSGTRAETEELTDLCLAGVLREEEDSFNKMFGGLRCLTPFEMQSKVNPLKSGTWYGEKAW